MSSITDGDARLVRIDSAPVASTGNPYSQATRFDDLVFVSGQVPFDPELQRVIDGDFEQQARKVFDNLTAVLAEAGASMETVLKTTCFLCDLDDAATFNKVYREYFPSNLPARSTFKVGGLSGGFRVEVEAIAGVVG